MGLKEPDSATLGAPILDTQGPDSAAEGVDGRKKKEKKSILKVDPQLRVDGVT